MKKPFELGDIVKVYGFGESWRLKGSAAYGGVIAMVTRKEQSDFYGIEVKLSDGKTECVHPNCEANAGRDYYA